MITLPPKQFRTKIKILILYINQLADANNLMVYLGDALENGNYIGIFIFLIRKFHNVFHIQDKQNGVMLHLIYQKSNK